MLLACQLIVALPSSYAINPLSLRLSAGGINYPLHQWSSYWRGDEGGSIDKEIINYYITFTTHLRLSKNYYIYMGLERLDTKASYRYIWSLNDPWLTSWNSESHFADTRFRSIPVEIGYENRFYLKRHRISPFYGIGLAFLFSSVETRASINQGPWVYDTRKGVGAGVSASFGLLYPFNRSLSGIVKSRARYADGLLFRPDRKMACADLSSFDVSLGLEYNL